MHFNIQVSLRQTHALKNYALFKHMVMGNYACGLGQIHCKAFDFWRRRMTKRQDYKHSPSMMPTVRSYSCGLSFSAAANCVLRFSFQVWRLLAGQRCRCWRERVPRRIPLGRVFWGVVTSAGGKGVAAIANHLHDHLWKAEMTLNRTWIGLDRHYKKLFRMRIGSGL